MVYRNHLSSRRHFFFATLSLLSLLLVDACGGGSDIGLLVDGDLDSDSEIILDGDDDTESGGPFSLTVLHSNDVHAHFMSFDGYGSMCSAQDDAAGDCVGGTARRATLIKQIRAQADDPERVLLLDAGDQFQGSLFYTRYKGAFAAETMNLLGYDAMCLGNHEFDDGLASLVAFIDALQFPVVTSNIGSNGDESGLVERIDKSRIIERDGRQIGLVGLISEDTGDLSNVSETIAFLPELTSVQQAVDDLKQAGVAIIVLLSHQGYASDVELAAQLDGVDVIVGGHSHTLLGNHADAYAPYPYEATSAADEPVIVVQSGENGAYLGQLQLTFDADGVVTAWAGDTHYLDASVPPDADMLALVMERYQAVEAMGQETVGATNVDLSGDAEICRFGECNLGNLITDAMRADAAPFGADIALINAGAIRADIPKGDISLAQLMTAFPFANTLAVCGLAGMDIRATLEHAVALAEDSANEGTGRFLQVSGLKFSWDSTADVGQRVQDVWVDAGNGAWEALDDDRVYTVATTDYLRGGGDGFEAFELSAVDPYDFGRTIISLMTRYLAEHSPVAPDLEDRIQDSGDK